MADIYLKQLCDSVTEAHTRIKQDFSNIDPIVGVSQKMRESGIPADVMTIDCLRSGKRIILILQDQQPGIISYQFTVEAEAPAEQFNQIPFADLSSAQLYDWMKSYFSNKAH